LGETDGLRRQVHPIRATTSLFLPRPKRKKNLQENEKKFAAFAGGLCGREIGPGGCRDLEPRAVDLEGLAEDL
jgi:hypothetical protein